MGESDMSMLQREILRLIKLLETDDDMVLGSIHPAALRNQSGTGSLEFSIGEDTLADWLERGTFDVDCVSGIDQFACCFGGEGRAV